MYQPEVPEIHTRDEHFTQDFLSTATATVVGAAIGSYMDRNTKFGHWINRSPTANVFFGAVKTLLKIAAVGMVILYFYLFFTAT